MKYSSVTKVAIETRPARINEHLSKGAKILSVKYDAATTGFLFFLGWFDEADAGQAAVVIPPPAENPGPWQMPLPYTASASSNPIIMRITPST